MGPRRWSRGRASRGGYQPSPGMGFNGATAMEPWKSIDDDEDPTPFSAASMGPRRWSRGRDQAYRRHWRRDGGFNGATAMEPWKSTIVTWARQHGFLLQWGHGDGAVEEVVFVPSVIVFAVLQWGHGDGAVEEVVEVELAGCDEIASMGPRRWSRGRDGQRRKGHEDVELQWGHGDGAVEEDQGSCTCGSTTSGFNGATAMEPWKSKPTSVGSIIWKGFNGATAMEPWKRDMSNIDPGDMTLLQWGHGDGAVEEASYIRLLQKRGMALQWGHGDGAVEEPASTTWSPPPRPASMGPRRWSRGRACELRRAAPDSRSFNGATAMEPWKRDGDVRLVKGSTAASMGPRRWSRGRGPTRSGVTTRWKSFNGATAMEPWKSRPYVGPDSAQVASMGPRRWSRGRGRDISPVARVQHASMGPRRWSRGRGRRPPPVYHASRAASMGPRRWSRGRAIHRRQALIAPMLQWGHGDGAVEEVRSPRAASMSAEASMGPRRWSRGRGTCPRSLKHRSLGFNGATAMEPWKRTTKQSPWSAYDASMGPRRWSRGRADVRVQAERDVNCFNGATAMEPWKRRLSSTMPAPSIRLQWGHGDGAVEEHNTRPIVVGVRELQWGHGDGAVEDAAPRRAMRRLRRLQWGHGDGAVEELRVGRLERSGLDMLQWGHGDGAVEEALREGQRRGLKGRFNGATAMEPWKSKNHIGGLSGKLTASMGPRRWSRGRGAMTAGERDRVDMLQWGHGDGAVEELKACSPVRRADELQWGHGDGAVEEPRAGEGHNRAPNGFNGATAMEPWKRSLRKSFCTVDIASMGPRRWSRGRADLPAGPLGGTAGFNGATAMEPWKSTVPWPGSAAAHASMGPRRWSRGRGRPA